jgi:hypothetical protein
MFLAILTVSYAAATIVAMYKEVTQKGVALAPVVRMDMDTNMDSIV